MKNLIVLSLLILQFCFTSCNYCSRKSNSEAESGLELMSKKISAYQPVLLSNTLSEKVDEQSGIVWYDKLFWVNNDSGCEPELYAYNKSGKLQRTVHIKNINNADWEDLTDDSEYFYIGEFGNNYGRRKDLRVLRVAKSQLTEEQNIELTADVLTFEWADQHNFEKRKHNHDFDCEAFFSYGDSLYLFSKNWANYKTRMYVMPKTKGHHKLSPKTEFNTGFMVTGADISSDGKQVSLIGYKDFKTYMYLLTDYKGTEFFSGNKTWVDMSPLGGAQTEGIVYGENDSLFICTEKTNQPQSIYRVEWEQWKN